MASIIGYAIVLGLLIMTIGIIVTVIVEENKLVDYIITHDIKDWSGLQAWNYMQEHKHDKYTNKDDRLLYLACEKIIKRRMR